MDLIILIFFSILFFAISIKRLDWALMLVLAGLPLYVIRFSVFGIPTTILEAMILIVFAIWILSNYKRLISNISSRLTNGKKSEEEVEDKKIINYPFGIELILVLIVAFIAMGVSGFSDSAMGIWKAYFFEPIIIYLLVFNIFFCQQTKAGTGQCPVPTGGLTKIILPLSISAFAISAFAIYQKITGNFIPNELWAATETRRATSFFGYPNAVGLFLGPIFMMMFGYLLFMNNKYKKQSCRVQCTKWSPFSFNWFKIMSKKEKLIFLFLKFSSFLAILAIYFAKSEGALVAITLALIVLVFFSQPFKSLGSARAVIVALAVFLLIFIFSFAPLREFVTNKISLNDFSGQIRKAQWQDTGIMLRDDNWLMGAGLNSYQEKIEPYHSGGIYIKNNDPDFERLIKVSPEYQAKHWQPLEIFLYPHNIFLNFWVELGLAGMLIFIWIILKVFFLSSRMLFSDNLKPENRYLLLGAMSAMLVLVVHGIVDVPYFKNDLAVIFWLIVGIVGFIDLDYKMSLKSNQK